MFPITPTTKELKFVLSALRPSDEPGSIAYPNIELMSARFGNAWPEKWFVAHPAHAMMTIVG
jgi:hypothetical protein